MKNGQNQGFCSHKSDILCESIGYTEAASTSMDSPGASMEILGASIEIYGASVASKTSCFGFISGFFRPVRDFRRSKLRL